MNRTLTLLVLLLPLLALSIWTASLFYTRAAAPEHIVKITGYDPRDLLHGRYIIFRYDWESANPPITTPPTDDTGRFYLPEDMAPIVESLFLVGKHDFAVRIHLQNNTPHIRDLLIDGESWTKAAQDSLANAP